MENKRVGYADVSYRLLEDRLHFPKDHHIQSVWLDMQDGFLRMFKIVIEGPGMPEVPEGAMIPQVNMYIGEVERCEKCGHAKDVVSFVEEKCGG